ncbi:hypothetical protein ACHQM5_030879 [Ranunculus cassubicifolius]
MAQKRSPLGRPQGTDGSDFSYRMTVDSRYVKVTKGKITLRYVIFIQVAIQLLGLLYLFIFPPKAGTFNLTLGAKLTAIILYSVGEIGRRRSSVFMLNIYKILAPLATLASNAVTAKHILDFKFREGRDAKVIGPMEVEDIFAYSYIVLGTLVEIFQVYTTRNLVRNMTPPKSD